MFDYRNGRKRAVNPGNAVVGFNRQPRKASAVKPHREALGRRIGLFTYRYAWTVHLVCIPVTYFNAFVVSFPRWLLVTCAWLVCAGFPLVLIGRVIANRLTVLDDARSYDAVKVYFVGLLLHFGFILIFGIVGKILG